MTSHATAPARLIRACGQNIAIYESSGTGPAVLLVHGNSSSARAYSHQLDSALGETLRIVAFDLPGHGASDRASDPSTAYTLPGYARVVCDLVEQLNLQDAAVVGWSLGGHIALEASAALPKAPGFMVFGTPPLAFPPARDAFFPVPEMSATFKAELTPAELEAYARSNFRPDVGDIPESFRGDIRRTDGRARAALGASFAPNGYADEIAIVAEMRKPLAILQGAEERLVNPAYFDRLTIPSLWRGRVQLIAGAGHAPQWEQPAAFNTLLEAFVADCRSEGVR